MNLATIRTSLYDALAEVDAELYRQPRTDYQYPAVVIGYPLEMDVRPAMAGARDITLPVTLAVLATDDTDPDGIISDLIDQVVDALTPDPRWDPRPAEFSVETLNDSRIIVTCQIPVAVFA